MPSRKPDRTKVSLVGTDTNQLDTVVTCCHDGEISLNFKSSIPKKHLWNNNILLGPKFPVVALKKSIYIYNSLTKENKAHRTLPRLF